MAISRMFFRLAVLLTAFFANPASAQQKPDDAAKVTTALQKYNEAEADLRRAGVMDANDLAAHFRRLAPIRARLEKLEQRHAIDPGNAALKREILRLLDQPIFVTVEGSAPRLRSAQELRLRDLVAIALMGNRRFGLNIRSVLGIQLEGGVS